MRPSCDVTVVLLAAALACGCAEGLGIGAGPEGPEWALSIGGFPAQGGPSFYGEMPIRDPSGREHTVVLGLGLAGPGEPDEGEYHYCEDIRICYRRYHSLLGKHGLRETRAFWEAGVGAGTEYRGNYDPFAPSWDQYYFDSSGSASLILGGGVRWWPPDKNHSFGGDKIPFFVELSVNVATGLENQPSVGFMLGWTFREVQAGRPTPSYGRPGRATGPGRTEVTARAREAAEERRERASLLTKPTREGVPVLIRALSDGSWRTRRRAAAALGRLGPQAAEAASALGRALKDGHSEVRWSAGSALVRIGAATVPTLVQVLEDTDANVRRRAADVLGRIGPPAKGAAYALSRALEDTDPDVCATAADALAEIRLGPEVAAVVPRGEEDPRLSQEARRLEREVGGLMGRAKEALETDRLDEALSLVKEALSLVPGHGDARRELDELEALIAERERKRAERKAREEAQRLEREVGGLMGRAKEAREADKLDEALSLAKEALSLVPGHEDARRELGELEALIAERERKRAEVARGLPAALRRPAKEGVPSLVWALERPDTGNRRRAAIMRRRAAAALARIGPEAAEAVPALSRALKHGDRALRARAASALGEIGSGAEEAVFSLAQALEDKDRSVRRSAASALGEIGPGAAEAVPALTRALKDADPDVRWAAGRALAGIGPAAAPALVEALEDADRNMRRRAADVLRSIGPPAKDAVPALSRALEDTDGRVRTSAARALERIQDEE